MSIKEIAKELDAQPKTTDNVTSAGPPPVVSAAFANFQVKEEQIVLNTIRCLAADLCQQFKGGHPGTVMGAAAIGIALWRYEMRYNPANPEWFNRDRKCTSQAQADNRVRHVCWTRLFVPIPILALFRVRGMDDGSNQKVPLARDFRVDGCWTS